MKTIVLFTQFYPYCFLGEEEFLAREVEFLSRKFRVILVPFWKKTDFVRKEIKGNPNISVYADVPSFSHRVLDFINGYRLFFSFGKSEWKNVKRVSHLKDLFYHCGKMFRVYKTVEKELLKGNWQRDYLYYTYWFDYATTALSFLKKKYGFRFITRAHGFDLYEEDRRNGYIPFRRKVLDIIDKVVTISKDGKNYLKRKYNYDNSINFYLGLEDKGIINSLNPALTLKIASCSSLVPVKNVDKMLLYLKAFSERKGISVEWYHIGDGPEREKLEKKAKELSSEKFKINFLGRFSNDEVFEFYKREPLDYFLNISSSEGLPFSIIEAINCGIPTLAPAVGGIPEIVKDGYNGFLLSSSPNIDEFSNILEKAYLLKKDEVNFRKMRENSRNYFCKNFEASKNYSKFMEWIEKEFF